MPKFDVGNRVLCMKGYESNTRIVNQKGTIIGFLNSGKPCIEFDEYVGGHDGLSAKIVFPEDKRGEYGHCWFVPEEYLVKIKDNNSLYPCENFIEAYL